MENSILNIFLDHGFKEKMDSSSVEKQLFEDFVVVATNEEGWTEDSFITFYIYASEFSLFIESVFSSFPRAKLVQPRKLTEDRSGCLCMVSSPIELVEGEWVVWLCGEELKLKDLLLLLSNIKSIEEFYEFVYFRNNGYFIWIETVWVYLFLKKRLGINSPTDISDDIRRDEMESLVKRWNLKSDLTVEHLVTVLGNRYIVN